MESYDKQLHIRIIKCHSKNMEPFGAFFGTKCTPYLEARLKARSGVKGLMFISLCLGVW